MSSARVEAQAKINLTLRVLAREASGYHAIETIFHRIELADVVTVNTNVASSSLDCAGPAMPDGGLGPVERNLAWRALDLYRRVTGWPAHAAIEIEKHIPVGGGLGGGSADAAAVLRALDAMAPRSLGSALFKVAGSLGADVPFLATDCAAALAWSRGDRMLALAPLPRRDVALVVPTVAVNTAEAYGWLAAEREAAGFSVVPGLLMAEDVASWEGLAALATNHFEPAVFARHPELSRLRDALRGAGAGLAMMSGSGSTIFGVFSAAIDRVALADAVAAAGTARIVMTHTATAAADVRLIPD